MILKKGESIVVSTEEDSNLEVTNIDGKLSISKVRNLAKKIKGSVLDYLQNLSSEYKYKDQILKMYDDWSDKYEQMPAGAKHHHTYEGGLEKHTVQVIDTALFLWDLNKSTLASTVSVEDIIVASFLHDFSKVMTYRKLHTQEEIDKNNGYPFKWDSKLEGHDMETWTIQKCMEYGIVLTEAQINAIFFAEGGFSRWGQTPRHPKWTTLAVLIACADLYSACALKK